MKKILVVEDYPNTQESWKYTLSNFPLELLQAFSVQDAEDLFHDNPDVDVVVMDACVPGSNPNTLGLVAQIRRDFKGPMIASSSDPDYRKKLIEAGCDFECPKEVVPYKILQVLNLI